MNQLLYQNHRDRCLMFRCSHGDDTRSRDSDDVPMPEFLRVLYSSVFQVLALFWFASIRGKFLLFPIPAITRDDCDSGDLLRFS
jgi:hypothetical protein